MGRIQQPITSFTWPWDGFMIHGVNNSIVSWRYLIIFLMYQMHYLHTYKLYAHAQCKYASSWEVDHLLVHRKTKQDTKEEQCGCRHHKSMRGLVHFENGNVLNIFVYITFD
jgi:hypothetical protein